MKEIEQAVILAGGRGERLRPLTDKVPKPMVMVRDKPFLEHLVVLLQEHGIKNYLFLVGYLGNLIRDYFDDGHKWGITITYSFEEKPLGTGGALRLAKTHLEENFFLLFGDSYLPIDYRLMAKDFFVSERKVFLAVYDNSCDTNVPFNIKLNNSKHIVVAYNKKKDNPADFNYCDAGVIAVNRDVVKLIEGADPISFEESIYPRLIKMEQLGCYIAEKRFYDIGTIERLKIFEQYLSHKTK